MSSGLVFLFGKMKSRPEAAGSGFIGDSQIVLQACYFCCSEQARGGFHDHDFLQPTALLFLAIGEQVGRVSGVDYSNGDEMTLRVYEPRELAEETAP